MEQEPAESKNSPKTGRVGWMLWLGATMMLTVGFAVVLISPSYYASAQESKAASGPHSDKQARPLAGYEIVRSTTPEAVQPGTRYGWNAECPTPKVALGGGYTLGDAINSDPELLVEENAPSTNVEGFYDGKFWHVQVKNVGSEPSYFTVYAVCAYAAR